MKIFNEVSNVNEFESEVSNLKSKVHHQENMVNLTSPQTSDYSLQISHLGEAKSELLCVDAQLSDVRAKLNNVL